MDCFFLVSPNLVSKVDAWSSLTGLGPGQCLPVCHIHLGGGRPGVVWLHVLCAVFFLVPGHQALLLWTFPCASHSPPLRLCIPSVGGLPWSLNFKKAVIFFFLTGFCSFSSGTCLRYTCTCQVFWIPTAAQVSAPPGAKTMSSLYPHLQNIYHGI